MKLSYVPPTLETLTLSATQDIHIGGGLDIDLTLGLGS